jgi:hypothetical protein
MCKRQVVISLTLLILALPTPAFSQQQHIYLITADGKAALTGFRANGTKGIITALHGVVGAKTITASSSKGRILRKPLTIAKFDLARDLALLSSPELEALGDDGLAVGLGIDWQTLREVAVIGYPIGIDLKEIRSMLKVRQPPLDTLNNLLDPKTRLNLAKRGSPNPSIKVLNLQGPLLPGHSGAPILDSQDRVVAVGNGGLRGGTVGHGWAVQLLEVKWESTQGQNSVKALQALARDSLFKAEDAPRFFARKLESLRIEYEREYVGKLEKFMKLLQVFYDGGIATKLQLLQVEQELAQTRIRISQLESAYKDAEGQLPEALQEIEDKAFHAFNQHFRRLEGIHTDHDTVRRELDDVGTTDKVSKLRPFILRSMTDSALTKNTSFGKNFGGSWISLAKHDNLNELQGKLQAERRRLMDLQTEFNASEKPFPSADSRRLENLEFHIDLVNLERHLRTYESERWKKEKDPTNQRRLHATVFQPVQATFELMLSRAVEDRFALCRSTWPQLPPVSVKGVDLLVSDTAKAEAIVTSILKGQDAADSGKRSLAKVRALANVYDLQKQLFEMSLHQAQSSRDNLVAPSLPTEVGRAVDGIVDRYLNALRSLSQVKGQIALTWFDYQLTRLRLCRELGLDP